MLYGPWAQAMCRSYARARRMDWRDVWGAAACALIEAVERYDPAWAVPFRAYSKRRVWGALMDSGRETFGGGRRPEAGDGRPEAGGRGPEAALQSPASSLQSVIPEPWEAAHARETRSRLFACLPDAQSREVARRRLWLGESVDEIGLAMGLAKSRVHEMLNDEVLPRLRRALRRLGIEPADRKPETQCAPPTAP